MGNRSAWERGRRKVKSLKRRLAYLQEKSHRVSWVKAEVTALEEAIILMEEKYPSTPPKQPEVCDAYADSHGPHPWYLRLPPGDGYINYSLEFCPGVKVDIAP